jgi:hypothetical protein
MNLATRVLGHTAVTKLTTTSREHILVIGTDKLTRGDLAQVGCYNFVAARYLTQALQQLDVTSLRDVFERVAPRDLALPHVGVISLAVLGAAFEARGIGGEAPLDTYVAKHQTKVVTFDTMKHRVQREAEAARRKRRRNGRRVA